MAGIRLMGSAQMNGFGLSGLDMAGVIAGLVALIILVDISVLWILGKPVPELLSYLATSVFGFYFGRDRGTAVRREQNDVGGPTRPPVVSEPIKVDDAQMVREGSGAARARRS